MATNEASLYGSAMGWVTWGIEKYRGFSTQISKINMTNKSLTKQQQETQRIALAVLSIASTGCLYVTFQPLLNGIEMIPLIGTSLGLVPKLTLHIAIGVLLYQTVANTLPFLPIYQSVYYNLPFFVRDSTAGQLLIPHPILDYHDRMRYERISDVIQLKGFEAHKQEAVKQFNIEVWDGYESNISACKDALCVAITCKSEFDGARAVLLSFLKGAGKKATSKAMTKHYLTLTRAAFNYLEALLVVRDGGLGLLGDRAKRIRLTEDDFKGMTIDAIGNCDQFIINKCKVEYKAMLGLVYKQDEEGVYTEETIVGPAGLVDSIRKEMSYKT